MTTNDLLAQAIGAARAEAEVGADDGAATRLRIRESLAKRGSKRRLWTLLAAAIGTMFASTAFALQAGWEPPWSSRTEAVAPPSPDPDPPSAPDAPRRTARAASEPSTTVRFESVPLPAPPGTSQAIAGEAPLPAPPVSADPAPARPSSVAAAEPRSDATAPSRAVTRSPLATAGASPRAASIAPPGTPASSSIDSPDPQAAPSIDPDRETAAKPESVVTPAPDAELAAYRTAHALHFRGSDPTAALSAWDALLAKFPSGRLAPEARFNRALTLIKLERWAEARAALAPFAAGGYRQSEAKQLLEAIAGR
jgi:hypothetical protein